MQGVQSTPSSNVSYRTEYEQKLDTSSPSYSYNSLDGDTNSWLAQQQQKLKNFKEGRDSSGRTEQEKKLVNELRFAQNKYYTRRTQSEEEERVCGFDSMQCGFSCFLILVLLTMAYIKALFI